ncbi:hypothetical protein GCM10020221_34490 [Streptomyces thioluteus]|uniref:Aminotransferase n=1 Tax=Streptomyces thioluteus TaxID=66431 RepID=A0ABP6JKU8_STRTU
MESEPNTAFHALYGIADPEERLAAYHAGLAEPPLDLSVAENVLLYGSLNEHVFRHTEIGENDIRYKTPYGVPELRARVAELLSRTMSHDIRPTDVYATAGVSAALECLAFTLEEAGELAPGDRVLLPAPSWQGFKWSFGQRPGLKCVFAPLRERGDAFQLTLRDLQNAYRTAYSPPKLLVLTNPNNPLGVNYDENLLEEIYTWALEETPMHIVSDEIYAHSQLTGAAPRFTSALALRATARHSDRVHVVWGLGKDFGISGFRVGFVISRSAIVRAAMEGGHERKTMSWFTPLDSLKNVVIGKLFEHRPGEPAWYPEQLMHEVYPPALTDSHQAVRRALLEGDVPYVVTGNSAQFFFLDLRAFLDRVPDAASPVLFPEIDPREERLRAYLQATAKVQLLPGQTLSCPDPGYFRLCFTAFEAKQVADAATRIGEALRTLPEGGRR